MRFAVVLAVVLSLLLTLSTFAIADSQSRVLVRRQIATNTTDSTEPPTDETTSARLCKPGTNVGSALVFRPNITSKVFMGTTFTIVWKFNNVLSPPAFWQIKYQRLSAKSPKWESIDDNVRLFFCGAAYVDSWPPVGFCWRAEGGCVQGIRAHSPLLFRPKVSLFLLLANYKGE